MNDDIVMQLSCSPSEVPSEGGEQQVKMRLRVQPSDRLRGSAKNIGDGGVDFCLVLDTSGSMDIVIAGKYVATGELDQREGRQTQIVKAVDGDTLVTKLDACKAAVVPLINRLRSSDTLSVVSFNAQAQTLCNMLRQNQVQKFEETVGALMASASSRRDTNMGPALKEATRVLTGGAKGRVKKIILLTDGEATDDDPSAAIQEANALAKRGWSIDCLGLGKEFNRTFLQELVASSLGRTEPLETPSDAERLFDRFLTKTQQVVATNLRLKVTFSSRVNVLDWYRGAPENLHLGKVALPDSSREFSVSLGNIERHQSYDYFFLVRVPSLPADRRPFSLGTAEMSFDLPSDGRTYHTPVHEWSLKVGAGRRPVVNSEIDLEFLLTDIGRLEKERDAAIIGKDHNKVLGIFDEIAQRYDKLGKDYKQAKEDLLRVKDEYVRTRNISLEGRNVTRTASATPRRSGELAEVLPEAAHKSIFG